MFFKYFPLSFLKFLSYKFLWLSFFLPTCHTLKCQSDRESIILTRNKALPSLRICLGYFLKQANYLLRAKLTHNLLLYNLKAKNGFTFFNGWKKTQKKNNSSWYVKFTWNSNFSVYKQGCIGTQPQSFTYVIDVHGCFYWTTII